MATNNSFSVLDSEDQQDHADTPEDDTLNIRVEESDESEEKSAESPPNEAAGTNPLAKPAKHVESVPIGPKWSRTGLTAELIRSTRNPAHFDEEEEEMNFWLCEKPQEIKSKIVASHENHQIKFKATDKAVEKGGYCWKALMTNKADDFIAWLEKKKASNMEDWKTTIQQYQEAQKVRREQSKEKKKADTKKLDAREMQESKSSLAEEISELGISSANLEEDETAEKLQPTGQGQSARPRKTPKKKIHKIIVRVIPRMGRDKKLTAPTLAEVVEAIDTHPLLSKLLLKEQRCQPDIKIKGMSCPTYTIEEEPTLEQSRSLPREITVGKVTYPLELKGTQVKLLEFSATVSFNPSEVKTHKVTKPVVYIKYIKVIIIISRKLKEKEFEGQETRNKIDGITNPTPAPEIR